MEKEKLKILLHSENPFWKTELETLTKKVFFASFLLDEQKKGRAG